MEKPHKRLEVWNLGMQLVLEVYRITKDFPAEERFGLIGQMRRAAVSVPSNIAEGAARNTRREFVNFLHTAQGSLSEFDTQFDLCERLGYVRSDARALVEPMMTRIDKMLTGLMKSLRRSEGSGVNGKG